MSAVKIGIAQDVNQRLSTLRTGNPDKLSLLLKLNGNQEAELHGQFSEHRLRGEWFKDAPILEWIASQNA